MALAAPVDREIACSSRTGWMDYCLNLGAEMRAIFEEVCSGLGFKEEMIWRQGKWMSRSCKMRSPAARDGGAEKLVRSTELNRTFFGDPRRAQGLLLDVTQPRD